MAYEQTPRITEDDLIADASRGNKEAAAKLFRTYERRLFSFAVKNVNNEQEAKDLVQDTYFKAWRAMKDGKYEPGKKGAKFSTWLFTILKRNILDRARKGYIKHGEVSLDQKIENIGNLENDPEIQAVLNERNVNLQTAIDQLSPTRKKIIELYYFEDMTAPEIARAIGRPQASVKMNIFRGREDLKDIVKKSAA